MRINLSRNKFGMLIRRYDGEGGGAAATTASASTTAATTTTTAEPSATAATTTTTDTSTQTATPFKTFASETEYQKDVDFKIQQALKTHEEKLKGKLTPEIRKQLEAEANMTAEQKVQAQLDQLETEKKSLATEKNRIKAETLFVAKNIGEAERGIMLDFCVSDDADASIKNAQAVLDVIERAVKEQIKIAMKDVKAPNSTATTGTAETADVSYAKNLAERRANAAKTSNNTIDRYLGRK